jgi:hypothetical protein
MNNENDLLKQIFSRLPEEEELSPAFKEDMMKKIMEEAKKRNRRLLRISYITIASVSIGFIALAILALHFAGIRIGKPELPSIDMSLVLFYLYIGAIPLSLLYINYYFCKRLIKKHS